MLLNPRPGEEQDPSAGTEGVSTHVIVDEITRWGYVLTAVTVPTR